MNKANNKRARNTDETIIRAAFAAMVEGKKPVSKITVREICERAKVNRSTFYAHYLDVYDLFEKVEQHMAELFKSNFHGDEQNWDFQEAMERSFAFIYEYREFFSLYFSEPHRANSLMHILTDPFKQQIEMFKSQAPEQGVAGEISYHLNFFTAGMGALIAHWLAHGCRETPRQLYEILKREYGERSLFNTWK